MSWRAQHDSKFEIHGEMIWSIRSLKGLTHAPMILLLSRRSCGLTAVAKWQWTSSWVIWVQKVSLNRANSIIKIQALDVEKLLNESRVTTGSKIRLFCLYYHTVRVSLRWSGICLHRTLERVVISGGWTKRPIPTWLYQITKFFPKNQVKLSQLWQRHPAILVHLQELAPEIFK